MTHSVKMAPTGANSGCAIVLLCCRWDACGAKVGRVDEGGVSGVLENGQADRCVHRGLNGSS